MSFLAELSSYKVSKPMVQNSSFLLDMPLSMR